MADNGKPRIVIFGAGNIGRSFIAPVFVDGGYEVVFADVAPAVLEALSTRDSYKLVEKTDEGERSRSIHPVRGVDAGDLRALGRELEGADICATCVGAAALPAVLSTIAELAANRTRSLDIILAENLKGAGDLARQTFRDSGIEPMESENRFGIIETSIGKMVPIMPAEVASADPLLCWAEPYNTLIVDGEGFRGPIPEAPDLMPVSPIAPWVARKLFIHNFGHAACAYLGHRANSKATYIWEVLEDEETAAEVRTAMVTSGEALRRTYPETFTAEDIAEHVDDLISRFRNRALGDSLYRVGRDLRRKLHRRDRVVGALELIWSQGMDIRSPLEVFRAALSFRAPGPTGVPDERDDETLSAASDPAVFIRDVVGLPEESEPELSAILIKAVAETDTAREQAKSRRTRRSPEIWQENTKNPPIRTIQDSDADLT